MSKNFWVISDTHFGHANIIKYCDRPFSSVHEMNETMRENWNSVVKEQDHVYHLGDVYYQKGMGDNDRDIALSFLSSLKGQKRLIVGNHDNLKDPVLHKVFEKILMWYQRPDWGCLFTHVPVHPSNLSSKWPRNAHGHIHNRQSPSKEYKNLCVEHTNYTPVNVESLL